MKESGVITENPIIVELPVERERVAEMFKEHEVEAFPVINRESKEFAGIITLKDLLDSPDEDQIGVLVQRDVPTIHEDEDLEEAVRLLDQDNRRLIVLDDGKVTGILTVGDVIRRVLTDRKDLEEDLRNYIDYSVATIWEETPLKCALRIMGLSKVIALPVLDDVGKLVGMVQEFDLIQDSEVIEEMNRSQLYVGSETQPWAWESNPILLISEKKIDLPQKPVKEVMETDVVTARPDDKVWQAANKMKQNNIEQLPVLDAEDNLIGVIRDVELIKSI